MRTELQKRIEEGESPQAIRDELFAEWQPRLYGLATRWLNDYRDAEEFVSTMLFKMHDNFADMIAYRPVKAWILRVARNELTDRYRRTKRSGGGEIQIEPDVLERSPARAPQHTSFEEQVETLVSSVEPLRVYLMTLLARGALRDIHIYIGRYSVGEGVPQEKLAADLGLSQGRISQRKSELVKCVRVAMYLCEILGLVRAPHRQDDIRSHLDLFDCASGLTGDDRAVLKRAGTAVRGDALDRPELLRKNAEVALRPQRKDRGFSLRELHDAESRYAAAIPNPAPHCIDAPGCRRHSFPFVTEGGNDE